jgi:hypothetical protein
MLKKYALIALIALSGLGNSLNCVEQKPGFVNNFKSWWNQPRIDYVEKNMPQVPPHPVYPWEEELEQFKSLGLNEKYTVARLPIGTMDSEMSYPFGKRYQSNDNGKNWDILFQYIIDVPGEKELEEIRKNIKVLNTEIDDSWVKCRKTELKKIEEEENGSFCRRDDFSVGRLKGQLEKVEKYLRAKVVRKELLSKYQHLVEEWINEDKKVKAEQEKRRAFAGQKENSFAAVPVLPYE